MASNRRAVTSRSQTWAKGLALFAGVMMTITGVLQILVGIVALVDDDFYVQTNNYTFNLDLTGWGWTQILLGVILAAVGIGVISGNLLARFIGIFIVSLVLINNFLFIPHYPFWSILLVALDGFIIWALLTAPSKDIRM